ncbi:hypothetical protein [Streptomyces sp. NPDC002588]|uniref:hypothetical protein n=1 Tax=Streptomyces sp. NPDC002588 TaxID=3154419 RepID=UPI003334921D
MKTLDVIVHAISLASATSRSHEHLTVGRRLRVPPPRNHVPLVAAQRQVPVTGGIGITPLPSMAEAAAAGRQPGRMPTERFAPAVPLPGGGEVATEFTVRIASTGSGHPVPADRTITDGLTPERLLGH